MNNSITNFILLDAQFPTTVIFRRWNKWYLNSKKSLQGDTVEAIASTITAETVTFVIVTTAIALAVKAIIK